MARLNLTETIEVKKELEKLRHELEVEKAKTDNQVYCSYSNLLASYKTYFITWKVNFWISVAGSLQTSGEYCGWQQEKFDGGSKQLNFKDNFCRKSIFFLKNIFFFEDE